MQLLKKPDEKFKCPNCGSWNTTQRAMGLGPTRIGYKECWDCGHQWDRHGGGADGH